MGFLTNDPIDRGKGFGTGTADDTGFQNQKRDPNWSPTGLGNAYVDGQYIGDNAYDQSVDQDRSDARKMRGSAPVSLDQGQANESRGLQMNALGMLRAQGAGTAPSAAAINSQRANEAAASNMAHAGGHGIGARLGAMGVGAPGMASTALAANAANANTRAGEVSAGQQAYAQGAGTVNTQDIGAATTNAQFDAAQRALAQQHEEYYDQLAYNTRRAQAANQIAAKTQTDQAINAERNYRDAKDQQTVDTVNTVASTTLGAATGGAGSALYNKAAGPAAAACEPRPGRRQLRSEDENAHRLAL